MKKTCLLLILNLGFGFLVASAAASDEVERERLFKTPDPSSLSPMEINRNSEVFLHNESLLMEDRGGYSESFYTGTEKNRFALGAQLSSNYQDPTELASIEIIISRQLKTFTEFWLSFVGKATRGKYEAMAEEIQSANGDIRREDSDQTITTLGVGGGYRFKLFSKAFGFDRFFEMIDAYLTYNMHLDGAEDTRYQGFGLQTDYGIHYRPSTSFYYGGKLSYSIASLKRSAEGEEKLQDRSLVFGWLALGIELGFYY